MLIAAISPNALVVSHNAPLVFPDARAGAPRAIPLTMTEGDGSTR